MFCSRAQKCLCRSHFTYLCIIDWSLSPVSPHHDFILPSIPCTSFLTPLWKAGGPKSLWAKLRRSLAEEDVGALVPSLNVCAQSLSYASVSSEAPLAELVEGSDGAIKPYLLLSVHCKGGKNTGLIAHMWWGVLVFPWKDEGERGGTREEKLSCPQFKPAACHLFYSCPQFFLFIFFHQKGRHTGTEIYSKRWCVCPP